MPEFYYKTVIVGGRDSYHGFLNIVIKANGYLPLVYCLKVCLQKFSLVLLCKMSWTERIIS